MIDHLGFKIDPEHGVIYGRFGRPIGSRTKAGYTLVSWWQDGKCRCANAHRVIWEAVHGPIPDGLEVNHKNGQKSDNRLENLEVVTHPENMLHAYRTGLQSVSGELNPYSKLTDADAVEIRRMRLAGVAPKSIAAQFGVSRRCVYDVCLGRTWKQVA